MNCAFWLYTPRFWINQIWDQWQLLDTWQAWKYTKSTNINPLPFCFNVHQLMPAENEGTVTLSCSGCFGPKTPTLAEADLLHSYGIDLFSCWPRIEREVHIQGGGGQFIFWWFSWCHRRTSLLCSFFTKGLEEWSQQSSHLQSIFAQKKVKCRYFYFSAVLSVALFCLSCAQF